VLCNLPGHRLIEAVDIPDGRRQVLVKAVEVLDGCPDCGVLSRRLHQRRRQRMRDFPVGGRPGEREVVVVRRRLVCAEPVCAEPGNHHLELVDLRGQGFCIGRGTTGNVRLVSTESESVIAVVDGPSTRRRPSGPPRAPRRRLTLRAAGLGQR
jgi:hypothetical protein